MQRSEWILFSAPLNEMRRWLTATKSLLVLKIVNFKHQQQQQKRIKQQGYNTVLVLCHTNAAFLSFYFNVIQNLSLQMKKTERGAEKWVLCHKKQTLCSPAKHSLIFYPPSSRPRTLNMINIPNSHKDECTIHLQAYPGVKLGPARKHASPVRLPRTGPLRRGCAWNVRLK